MGNIRFTMNCKIVFVCLILHIEAKGFGGE